MKASSGKKTSVLDKMHDHFMHIAPRYRELRTTDLGPLLFITNKMTDLCSIRAADIGCGTGRYSIKFVEHLGEKCHLFCVDNNMAMLRHLREHFARYNISNFTTIRSDSHRIPLQTDSLDCVTSFNAIHHFSLQNFLRESSRILKNNGKLFVYTRLQDQNANTIWGMHFPSFTKKENRLYELDELKAAFEKDPNLNINSVKLFEHHRVYPLEKLVEQAKNHHYSTFRFYRKHEFREALHKFVQNILNHYDDLDKISWKDQNTLLVVENVQ
ncbi:MAG: class I SAM-dependent methyltransferase [Thaumarchaeota archaeon]|nr:class I SAM-dependent methyltransferase [Nitrososphaerota archaeon]